MKILYRCLIGLLVFGYWLPIYALATQDKPDSVVVQGEAIILEGNLPQARQRALQEAFSAALTQVLGSFISAESYTHNYESIERGVYGKTQGYIKNYQILDETVNDSLLAVTARVTVSADAVQNDLTALGIILDTLGNPVMVVEGTDEGLAEPWSIQVFRQKLAESGFRVLESDDAKADLIVRLEGRIQNISDLNLLQGALGSVHVAAYWQDSGRLILSESEVSNGAGVTEEAALKAAYTKATGTVFPRFLQGTIAKWQDEINNGRPLEIVVTDADYRQVQAFQQRLSRIFGIRKTELKNFKPGQAALSVTFSGTADLLAQLIHRTDFLQLIPEIVDISAERISLILVEVKMP